MWSADDHAAVRAAMHSNTSLLPPACAVRQSRWAAKLRTSLASTPVAAVRSSLSLCSATDVFGALAAFPHARTHTLVSREPLLGKEPWSSIDHQTLWGCFRMACAGGFMLGHKVREFASRWGALPLLLAALRAAGLTVLRVSRWSPGGLDGMQIECAGRRQRVRYVQAELYSRPNLSALFGAADLAPERPAGALIKGAEATFRGGDVEARGSQGSLSRALLAATDVLLQDTMTGVRWPLVRAWACNMVPLGTLVLPSIETNVTDDAVSQRQIRTLWRSSRWRSLRGQRFGYCASAAFIREENDGVPAALLRPNDVPTRGEEGEEERGEPMHCGVLLAWRRTSASGGVDQKHACDAPSRFNPGQRSTIARTARSALALALESS